MPARVFVSLFLILILAVACVPMTTSPAATSPATSEGPATPEGPLPPVAAPTAEPTQAEAWQTYTNPEIGLSIQYPPDWTQTEIPPSQTMQAIALNGPEGSVELYWGTGFGGACAFEATTVTVAQGQLPTCYSVEANGVQHWEQINKQLSTTSFSGRAFTKNAEPASGDAVLAVLATLSFAEPASTALANPASENCVAQGGKLSIEQRGDQGEFGVCYFEDNQQCEEWALLRGECPVGGVKVTGYASEAGRYCAITGGTYTATGNSGQADEQGTCVLPGGVQCDADAYYNGKCDAASGAQQPAPAATLTPPSEEVRHGMAQALSEALFRGNRQRAMIEVTEADEPVPMNDVVTGAQGTGWRAVAGGTGQQFASPDAVLKSITEVLTGGGWIEDPMLAAGGPTGAGSGYRSGDLLAIAGVIWLPDPAANCPQDQPIAECKLTPAQKLYTITLDTARSGSAESQAPIGMANPASQNCVAVGGTSKIETRGDGGQYGVCYFEDNRQCEEWALLRGTCPVGGVKVTGYVTPAATYCAITGGTYTAAGTTPDGQEDGICALPTGEACPVWQYYNGACGAPAS